MTSWNTFFQNALGIERTDIDKDHILLSTRANELLLTCKLKTESEKLHKGKDYQHCPICGMELEK